MGQFDLDVIKENVELENNNTINNISTNLILENIFRCLKETTTKKVIIKNKDVINTYQIRYTVLKSNYIDLYLTIKNGNILVVLDNSVTYYYALWDNEQIRIKPFVDELNNIIINDLKIIYNCSCSDNIYLSHCCTSKGTTIEPEDVSYKMMNICGVNPYYFYIINELYKQYNITPVFLKTTNILDIISINDITTTYINTELETIYIPSFKDYIGNNKTLKTNRNQYFKHIVNGTSTYIKQNYNVLCDYPFYEDYHNWMYKTSINFLYKDYMEISQFKNIKPIPCTFKGKDDVCIGKELNSLGFIVYSVKEYDIAVSRLVIIYTLFYNVKELLYIHRGDEKEYMFKDPDLVVYKMAKCFNKHPEEVLHDIKARYNWICENYVDKLNDLIKNYIEKR